MKQSSRRGIVLLLLILACCTILAPAVPRSWASSKSIEFDLSRPDVIERIENRLESSDQEEVDTRLSLLWWLEAAYRTRGRFEEGEQICRRALDFADQHSVRFSDLRLQGLRQELASYIARRPFSRTGESFLKEQLRLVDEYSSSTPVRISWTLRLAEYYAASDMRDEAIRTLDVQLRALEQRCSNGVESCARLGEVVAMHSRLVALNGAEQ